MKRVTASEARRNWFRLLDEVAGGEVVLIERAGRRIVLSREPEADGAEDVPDYSELVSGVGAEGADRWHWEWPGPEDEVHLGVERDDP